MRKAPRGSRNLVRDAENAPLNSARDSQDELGDSCYPKVAVSGCASCAFFFTACQRRRLDAVVVRRFNRLARWVSHLLRALETFKALGVEFVSLSEEVDTSTPTGKMVFTVVGAVAELERSLIAERVKAGLRNARAKGKRLGRARVVVDAPKITALRAQGRSWREVCAETGLSKGTAERALSGLPRNV